MRILQYIDLDYSRVAASFAKVSAALARGDFRSAEVKKLVGHQRLYRARLDHSNRLLLTLVRHGEEVCVLLLEVIHQHAYDKSRFLRGTAIDETRMIDADAGAAGAEAEPLKFLHPQRPLIHLLDKPISFDDAQDAVFQQAPPLIIVGSAGSGKTALTLEKLKTQPGQVLYVTLSAFLAASARDLYYAHGFDRDDQEVQFLSLREFLETLHIPSGQEADWSRFRAWFARHRTQFRDLDPHQVFEEFRGVLTASADGVLSQPEYLDLGVRQSIYPQAQREQVYALFKRYQEWLAATPLFDLNLLAHAALPHVTPRWDFVVIDEVQDLTPIQLKVLLKGLRRPEAFLLCGDSNQIVHPNFFSWSQVKTLLWHEPELAQRQQLRILTANFRNAAAITRVANTLLRIKHSRFGSIDRESNFLVDDRGAHAGLAQLLPDQESRLRELDRNTRQSHEVAVIVLREEDKAAARQYFSTPLLFSVHEAKGLEYPQVILFRLVSGQRAEFAELVEGVSAADLQSATLDYRRGRDKADKSLEIYKFFVNALYVALTRAVQNVFLVESDLKHPLLALLDINHDPALAVAARAASREEWQLEARRLEMQGKQEQAEAIRRDVLKQARPPWPDLNGEWLSAGLCKIVDEPHATGGKLKQQLLEYGSVHQLPELVQALTTRARYGAGYAREQPVLWQKHLAPYAARNFKDVLRQCESFGVDHRTPMGLTPLICATAVGNLPLVDALLAAGANIHCATDYGQQAVHWALRMAFSQPAYAQGPLAPLFERLAPAHVDVQTGQRLVRIDRRHAEYLLLQTLLVLLPHRQTTGPQMGLAVDTQFLLERWQYFPESLLPAPRRKRASLSSLLSRNAVGSSYPYSRAICRRYAHGRYQLDLGLRFRHGGGTESDWRSVRDFLRLDLLAEVSPWPSWSAINFCLSESGQAELPVPLLHRQEQQREQAEQERWQAAEAARRQAAQEAEAARLRRSHATQESTIARLRRQLDRFNGQTGGAQSEPQIAPDAPARATTPSQPLPWGSPAARLQAMRELEERNVQRRLREQQQVQPAEPDAATEPES